VRGDKGFDHTRRLDDAERPPDNRVRSLSAPLGRHCSESVRESQELSRSRDHDCS